MVGLKRFSLTRRLSNASITTKLIGIVVTFLIAIAGVIAMVQVAFMVTTGIQAYILGQDVWSRAQKDAIYALSRYAQDGDPQDYDRFNDAVTVMFGDRAARDELLKPRYDRSVVRRSLIAGGNVLTDSTSLIFVLRHFRDIDFVDSALKLWFESDKHIDELVALAGEIHDTYETHRNDPRRTAIYLERIDRINAALTPLERRFSSTLASGARSAQAVMFIVIVVVAEGLLTLGLLVSWLISRDLRASIDGLREGAVRVARGELDHRITVRSKDELGDLTNVFNDMISRRRVAESALIAATHFHETVMESVTDAIFTMDTEGRFTTANRRTSVVTGYPVAELISQPWASLFSPEHLPEMFERLSATIQGRGPILNFEVPLIQKGSNIVLINFSAVALKRDGLIFGVVGAISDITDRKRAEQELKTRAEELARSNKELEQFAYVASHDLQEPLRTVSGFAQLLSKRYVGKLGPEADEYIGYVTSGAQRMKSLIEDLLAFSRVTREARAVLPEVDLNQVVRTALANTRAAIENAGASVTCEPLPTVPGNERQLVQLFQNLVGNAVKFRREVQPVVHISADEGDGEWRFTVRDNGIGISPQHAEQVFGLFQRLHARDKYPGNGIGLTICKKTVDLHGGRIWCVPSDTGAVFRFTLKSGQHDR